MHANRPRAALLALFLLGCPQPAPLNCDELQLTTTGDVACTARFEQCSDAVTREVACVAEGESLSCECLQEGERVGAFFSDDFCLVVETVDEDQIRTATVASCPWDLHDPDDPEGDDG